MMKSLPPSNFYAEISDEYPSLSPSAFRRFAEQSERSSSGLMELLARLNIHFQYFLIYEQKAEGHPFHLVMHTLTAKLQPEDSRFFCLNKIDYLTAFGSKLDENKPKDYFTPQSIYSKSEDCVGQELASLGIKYILTASVDNSNGEKTIIVLTFKQRASAEAAASEITGHLPVIGATLQGLGRNAASEDMAGLLSVLEDIEASSEKSKLLDQIRDRLQLYIPFTDIFINTFDPSETIHHCLMRSFEPKGRDLADFMPLVNSSSGIGAMIMERVMDSKTDILEVLQPSDPGKGEHGEYAFFASIATAELIAVPLRQDGSVFAIMYLGFEFKPSISRWQKKIINILSAYLARAIQRMRDRSPVLIKHNLPSQTFGLSKALTTLKDRIGLEHIFSHIISGIVAHDAALIMVYNVKSNIQSTYLATGPVGVCRLFNSQRFSLTDAIYDRITSAGLPAIFQAKSSEPDMSASEFSGRLQETGMKEFLALPLHGNNSVFGAVYLMSNRIGNFSSECLPVFREIVNQLSIKVYSLNSIEKISKAEKEKSLIIEMAKSLAPINDFPALLEVFKHRFGEIFKGAGFIFSRLNSASQWETEYLASSQNTDVLPDFSLVADRDLFLGYGPLPIGSGTPLLISVQDRWMMEETFPSSMKLFEGGLKTMLLLCFSLNSKLIAMIGLCDYGHANISHAHRRFMEGISVHLSAVMARIDAVSLGRPNTEEETGQTQNTEDEESNLDLSSSEAINHGIVGISPAVKKVVQLISRVSKTGSSVLILGETGTGKELIARAIHNDSLRKNKAMVKINCAALAPNLIESELFGHERGSFTGATDRRIGKFELAHNGTLFLDEIGEMPMELQVKLLRALQEKEIERVGGKAVIKTDVRIIAATNRDLQKEVLNGNFRSDLYFRLNVFPILAPPLRDRKEDIPLLANHFLIRHAQRDGKKVQGFSCRVLKELGAYNWPGNIRELEHLIERSLLVNPGPIISRLHLPNKIQDGDQYRGSGEISTIDEVERAHIMHVLNLCKGKVAGIGGAAEALKIPSTTLNSKIKRLGIKKRYTSD